VIEYAVKSTRGAERIIPDRNMRQAGGPSGQMVEAGGIEPPSEDLPEMATTRLFRDLISLDRRPRTGCAQASRF
jgi:hypothetical protein